MSLYEDSGCLCQQMWVYQECCGSGGCSAEGGKKKDRGSRRRLSQMGVDRRMEPKPCSFSQMKKIMVAVAPVNPELKGRVKSPITPEEIAEDVINAAEKGASLVHLHVRDEEGAPTYDLYHFSRTIELIRKQTDIIIEGSTGGLSELSLDERCVSLNEPEVEIASLNMGSANFGEKVYINTLPDIRYWAGRMKEQGIRPELEIFEGGMIDNLRHLAEEGCLEPPFLFGLCLGVKGALSDRPDNLLFLRGLLPPDAAWGLIHHQMKDFSLLAAAAVLGASFVRVGFEDSIYYTPGKAAENNTELVARVSSMLKIMGFEIVTAHEARKMLS